MLLQTFSPIVLLSFAQVHVCLYYQVILHDYRYTVPICHIPSLVFISQTRNSYHSL